MPRVACPDAPPDSHHTCPRAAFVLGAAMVSLALQFLVRASFIEIYNEEIRDLLSKDPMNKLELREHVDSGVYAKVRRCLLLEL